MLKLDAIESKRVHESLNDEHLYHASDSEIDDDFKKLH